MNVLLFIGDFYCLLYLWTFFLFSFLQPFDDFEACFYASVGECSNLRTEV